MTQLSPILFPFQSRANIDFLTEYEYEYIRKVEFPIFVFKYPVFRDKNSNIWIYSDIRPLQKTIFDWIRIRIYSRSQIYNIHIRISSIRRLKFEYSNIFGYSPFTKDNFWPNTNTNIFAESNLQYSYSNIKYSKTNIRISEYIWKFALHSAGAP